MTNLDFTYFKYEVSSVILCFAGHASMEEIFPTSINFFFILASCAPIKSHVMNATLDIIPHKTP